MGHCMGHTFRGASQRNGRQKTHACCITRQDTEGREIAGLTHYKDAGAGFRKGKGMEKANTRNELVNETEREQTQQGHKVDPVRIQNRRQ